MSDEGRSLSEQLKAEIDNDDVEIETVEDDDDQTQTVLDHIFGAGEKGAQMRDQLIEWLAEELEEHRPGDGSTMSQDRAEFESRWETWRRMSMARPRSTSVSKPWKNASNMATPFMFSQINGVMSHVKSAITEKRPRLKTKSMNKKYAPNAAAIGRWINNLIESPLHVNLPKYDTEIPYETARMGTEVIETTWVQRRTQLKRMLSSGPVVVDKIVYEGPEVQTYRLEDVFIRNEFENAQDTPVVFLRSYYTHQDMKAAGAAGEFVDVEEVLSSGVDQKDANKTAENQIIGLDSSLADNPTPSQLIEVIKAYVRFDADEDGLPEDLIVWFHPDTHTILKAEFNEIGVRPVTVSKYIHIPGQFYGLGVGWMLEPIQAEIDTLHNIRINSLHISSLQMFATRPGAEGIGPDEDFYPFKRIPMEEPGDFQVISFPDTSGGTFQGEQVSQQYGQTVTGIAANQLGMPDMVAKSGTSPTLQQFLSEQGNKVLRSIIKNAEMAQSEMGMHILLSAVANSSVILRDGKLLELADEEDRRLIEEVLLMNVEDIPHTFQFTVRSTPADETQDAKRQMVLTKMQLYTQYFQMAMQIQQMMASPELPPQLNEFLQKMFIGFTNITEETLKLYDVEDIDSLLPNIRQQELMLEMMDVMKKPQIEQLENAVRSAKNGGQMGSAGSDMGAYDPGLTGPMGAERQSGMEPARGVPQAPAGGGGPQPGGGRPGPAGPTPGGAAGPGQTGP